MASALSVTACTTSSRSVLVTDRTASRSLASVTSAPLGGAGQLGVAGPLVVVDLLAPPDDDPAQDDRVADDGDEGEGEPLEGIAEVGPLAQLWRRHRDDAAGPGVVDRGALGLAGARVLGQHDAREHPRAGQERLEVLGGRAVEAVGVDHQAPDRDLAPRRRRLHDRAVVLEADEP